MFYIYIHKRKDTGLVFYVGKGSGYRFCNKSSRGSLWYKTVAEAGGFSYEKLYSSNNEDEILCMEEYLIKENPLDWNLINIISNNSSNRIPNELLQNLLYDETSTSCVRWLTGEQAGYLDGQYFRIRWKGNRYWVHRVIWAMFNGDNDMNKMVINHINQCKLDNSIGNLELVSQKVNCIKSYVSRTSSNLGKV